MPVGGEYLADLGLHRRGDPRLLALVDGSSSCGEGVPVGVARCLGPSSSWRPLDSDCAAGRCLDLVDRSSSTSIDPAAAFFVALHSEAVELKSNHAL